VAVAVLLVEQVVAVVCVHLLALQAVAVLLNLL
jgi:hypothetical protein